MPVIGHPARPHGHYPMTIDDVDLYNAAHMGPDAVFTAPFNASGLPAMSVAAAHDGGRAARRRATGRPGVRRADPDFAWPASSKKPGPGRIAGPRSSRDGPEITNPGGLPCPPLFAKDAFAGPDRADHRRDLGDRRAGTAKALAAHGAGVMINGRDAERGAAVHAAVGEAGGTVALSLGDVADPAYCDKPGGRDGCSASAGSISCSTMPASCSTERSTRRRTTSGAGWSTSM